jgi:hypothetical protein
MVVATGAVRTAFRFKRFLDFVHDQVHGAQHIGQHMVGFYLEVIGFELNRHMAVAQMVGGARQVKGRAVRRAGRDAQHRLRRGNHLDHGAVFGDQHVAAAHQRAARQEHAQLAAQRVGRVEAAFLAHVPVELNGGGAFNEDGGEARALRNDFGNLKHEALKTRLGKKT